MRISTVILAVLASAVFVASAPHSGHHRNVLRLSGANDIRISNLIDAGDDPAALAGIIGDHQVDAVDVFHLVRKMAHLDRVRSLEYLLPRLWIRRPDDLQHDLAEFLRNALEAHRPEQCEVLLRQGPAFEYVHSIGEFFCTTAEPIHWTLGELVQLVDHHHGLAPILEPSRWHHCRTAARCLLMLDLLRRLKEIDAEIANRPENQPDALVRQIMANWYLDEDEMIPVMVKLVDMGLNLDDALIDQLERGFYMARRPRVVQFLRGLAGQEIKEPATD